MNKYKLLKDLPFCKAGTIFIKGDGYGGVAYLYLIETDRKFDLSRTLAVTIVENNQEWFEEIKEPGKYEYTGILSEKARLALKHIEDHPNSLYIEYNDFWSIYETIDDYIEEQRSIHEHYITKEEEAAIRKFKKVWEIQYYVNTPVGFIKLYSPSLEEGLIRIYEYIYGEEK